MPCYAYEEALAYFQRALAAKEGQPVDAETAAALFGLARSQAAAGRRLQVLQELDNLKQSFEYYAGVGDVDRAVAVAEFPGEGCSYQWLVGRRFVEISVSVNARLDVFDLVKQHRTHGSPIENI